MSWLKVGGGSLNKSCIENSSSVKKSSTFLFSKKKLPPLLASFLSFSFSLSPSTVLAQYYPEDNKIGDFILTQTADGSGFTKVEGPTNEKNPNKNLYWNLNFTLDKKDSSASPTIQIQGNLSTSLASWTDFLQNFETITLNGNLDHYDRSKPSSSWLPKKFPDYIDIPNSDLIVNYSKNGDAFTIRGWQAHLNVRNVTINIDNGYAAFGIRSGDVTGNWGDGATINANSLVINQKGQDGYGLVIMPGIKASNPKIDRIVTVKASTEINMLNGGVAVGVGFIRERKGENSIQKDDVTYGEAKAILGKTSITLKNESITLKNESNDKKPESYGLYAGGKGIIEASDLNLVSELKDSIGIYASKYQYEGVDNESINNAQASVQISGNAKIKMLEGVSAIEAGKSGTIEFNKNLDSVSITVEGNVNAVSGGKVVINSGKETGPLNITGDIVAQGEGSLIDVKATTSDSIINSYVAKEDGGQVDITLGNGAQWVVKGESNVTNLTIENQNSRVLLNGDEQYNTLTIDNLSGAQAATFVLHTDLLGKGVENANDRLIIKASDRGRHKLHIPSTGQGAEEQSNYLVYVPSSVAIELETAKHKDGKVEHLVDQGLYLYELTKDENVKLPTIDAEKVTREGENLYHGYYLTLAGKVIPDTPDTPDLPKPVVPLLSPTAKAVLAMAGMGGQNAMYHNQLSDLRKRLGEIRGFDQTAGLWTSVSGQKDRFSGLADNGVKQNAYRFNLGLDYKLGDWLVGGNFKYLRATQKTTESDSHAKGRVNSAGFNLYGTWMNDVGCYADIVASFDHYHQKITTSMLDGTGVKGKVNNIGLGLSAEIGKKFELTHDFFVEPQAQLAYYWIKGKDFEMSNGMKVKQENFNSLNGRLGVVVGKDFKDAAGNRKGQVHFRGGVKQQLVGNQKIAANTVKFEDDLKGTSGYYGLGFEATPNKKFSVYGHIERENGKHYTKEVEVMVGLRYRF